MNCTPEKRPSVRTSDRTFCSSVEPFEIFRALVAEAAWALTDNFKCDVNPRSYRQCPFSESVAVFDDRCRDPDRPARTARLLVAQGDRPLCDDSAVEQHTDCRTLSGF